MRGPASGRLISTSTPVCKVVGQQAKFVRVQSDSLWILGASQGMAHSGANSSQARNTHATGQWVRVTRHWLVRSWLRDRQEISQDAWVFFGLAKAGVKCGGKVPPTWRRDLASSQVVSPPARGRLSSWSVLVFPYSPSVHHPPRTYLLFLFIFYPRTAASSGTYRFLQGALVWWAWGVVPTFFIITMMIFVF